MEVINQSELLSYINNFPAEAEPLVGCLLMMKCAEWWNVADIARTFAACRIEGDLVVILLAANAAKFELLLKVDYANERIFIVQVERSA